MGRNSPSPHTLLPRLPRPTGCSRKVEFSIPALALANPTAVAASFTAAVRAEALAKMQREKSEAALSAVSRDTCNGVGYEGDSGTARVTKPPGDDGGARANDNDETYLSSYEVNN